MISKNALENALRLHTLKSIESQNKNSNQALIIFSQSYNYMLWKHKNVLFVSVKFKKEIKSILRKKRKH